MSNREKRRQFQQQMANYDETNMPHHMTSQSPSESRYERRLEVISAPQTNHNPYEREQIEKKYNG